MIWWLLLDAFIIASLLVVAAIMLSSRISSDRRKAGLEPDEDGSYNDAE